MACCAPQRCRTQIDERSVANAVVDELVSDNRTCYSQTFSKTLQGEDVPSHLKLACHICDNKGVRRSKNCVFSKSSAESVFSG